ncbi:hypothetical protein BDV59DRAFT_174340 [Aspergillus ambiguus]|uniref:NAD(P)/FAD-dependent oxidoreductase n=1 Tax=Aspergillus ambiguus TaxID=176160 RepID=UPI003CCCC7D3
MMTDVNIVVIGASFAGIPIAHSLLKSIPSIHLTLVNPSPTFYFPLAAPRILAKPTAFRPDQYLIPIEDAFSQYAPNTFTFIKGKATSMDAKGKTVTIDDQKVIPFDYLVIASGSTTESTTTKESTPIPFKQSNCDNMGSLITDAQNKISNASKIVIGGAGPIGVELAGELAENAENLRRAVSITLISATDRVLPMLKPSGSEAALNPLRRKNVTVRTSRKVTGTCQIAGSESWEVTLDNGERLEADMYISATGVIPNNNFIPRQFLDEQGWVKLDKELRIFGHPEEPPLPIFAAGDITAHSMRMSFKAQEQAAVVADNITAEILGQTTRRSYDQGTGVLMLVPVGSCGGTGQLFGFTPWSVMVWLIKGRDFFISKARSAVYA